MPDTLEDRIITFVSESSDVPKEKIKPENTFDQLAFDSLAFVELALKLRKDFGVDASDEELDQIGTVGELIDLVKSKQSA